MGQVQARTNFFFAYPEDTFYDRVFSFRNSEMKQQFCFHKNKYVCNGKYCVHIAQKMKFSIKDFFSKNPRFTLTVEILNGRLHFLCSVISSLAPSNKIFMRMQLSFEYRLGLTLTCFANCLDVVVRCYHKFSWP